MTITRLLLVAGVVLAVVGWAVLVPRRPSPGGPHAVGRIELTLRDARGGSIPTTVWYPTAGSRGAAAPAENAPFGPHSPAPVILYSPGWAGTRAQSSIQAENLASHGFVVVGCDDYASDPAADPDRGVSLELSSDDAMAATLERAGRHVVTQAVRLLEILRALESGQSSHLVGKVDLRQVGVLGYSIGGAAGLPAALMDPRIVAVFSVDGGLFGPPATQLGSESYFLFSSREAFPSESDLASPDPFTRNYASISAQDLPRNARRMERPGSYWVVLDKADHGDLSDALFQFSRSKALRTNSQRHAMIASIEAYEVAFFRSVLLVEHGPLLGLRDQKDQTARWISSTAASAGAAKARQ